MTDQCPLVQTAAGKVLGIWREQSAAFYGIPFAQAPVGELRFAEPVRALPWDGATRPPPQPRDGATIPEPSSPATRR